MYPAAVPKDDNPFIPILVNALRANGVEVSNFRPFVPVVGTPEVLHLHWLEKIFWGPLAQRLPYFPEWQAELLVRVARRVCRAGGKVVWTVHNLAPHDVLCSPQKKLWGAMLTSLLPSVTDVVVMSESSSPLVRSTYPALTNAQFHVVPHPHYIGYFASRRSDTNIRAKLGISTGTPFFVCAGKMRPYKQIVEIIRLLREDSTVDFRLLIAGDGDEHYCNLIKKEIASDARFTFDNRVIPESELADYLSSADAAIFNFASILNSGSVLTALSLGTPVLCPRAGALTELAAAVGPDWVRAYEGSLTSEWLMRNLAELTRPTSSRPDLEFLSPQNVARSYAKIYRSR